VVLWNLPDVGGATGRLTEKQLTIVPANEAAWDDLAAIFGTTDPGRGQCQRYKVVGWIWRDSPRRSGPRCSGFRPPAATRTLQSPAGWCLRRRRTGGLGRGRATDGSPKLRTSRVPWSGRDEDKGDDGIWAVTCFVVRKGYRGRGPTYPLARPRSTSPASAARGR